MGDGVDMGTPQSSQLDCWNPEVRNRKGAQSGPDTAKIAMTTRASAVLKKMEMGLREKIPEIGVAPR